MAAFARELDLCIEAYDFLSKGLRNFRQMVYRHESEICVPCLRKCVIGLAKVCPAVPSFNFYLSLESHSGCGGSSTSPEEKDDDDDEERKGRGGGGGGKGGGSRKRSRNGVGKDERQKKKNYDSNNSSNQSGSQRGQKVEVTTTRITSNKARKRTRGDQPRTDGKRHRSRKEQNLLASTNGVSSPAASVRSTVSSANASLNVSDRSATTAAPNGILTPASSVYPSPHVEDRSGVSLSPAHEEEGPAINAFDGFSSSPVDDPLVYAGLNASANSSLKATRSRKDSSLIADATMDSHAVESANAAETADAAAANSSIANHSIDSRKINQSVLSSAAPESPFYSRDAEIDAVPTGAYSGAPALKDENTTALSKSTDDETRGETTSLSNEESGDPSETVSQHRPEESNSLSSTGPQSIATSSMYVWLVVC